MDTSDNQPEAYIGGKRFQARLADLGQPVRVEDPATEGPYRHIEIEAFVRLAEALAVSLSPKDRGTP